MFKNNFAVVRRDTSWYLKEYQQSMDQSLRNTSNKIPYSDIYLFTLKCKAPTVSQASRFLSPRPRSQALQGLKAFRLFLCSSSTTITKEFSAQNPCQYYLLLPPPGALELSQAYFGRIKYVWPDHSLMMFWNTINALGNHTTDAVLPSSSSLFHIL